MAQVWRSAAWLCPALLLPLAPMALLYSGMMWQLRLQMRSTCRGDMHIKCLGEKREHLGT